MATPYLVKADLATFLYAENIEEITRGDDDKVDTAINAAIAQAKSYLSRFNKTKLFDPDADGFFNDENLKNMVTGMACWNLVQLANPNIALDIIKSANDDAIAWLKDVQAGKADPDGWPYKDDDPDTSYPEGAAISMVSGTPRNNKY